MKTLNITMALGLSLIANTASAQTRATVEEIVVQAHPLSSEGLAQAAVVLQGEALAKKLEPSIGATLANEPGIHSAPFGQAASRPIVHGLGGARVRIMEDRIDSMDASVTSADHATTVEPYIADRIEVLKGASTLVYGSGAIGGVVDVHTGRIPHQLAEQPISGKAELRGGDNGDPHSAALRLDGSSGALAWHIDGFSREADEYEIPGFAESARLRALEEAEHDDGDADHEEEHEEEEVRGKLPGSQYEADGGAVGLSYITDRGFIGVAVSGLDASYGIPGGHGHEHEEEHGEEHGEEHEGEADEAEAEAEGNPVLDMEQLRVDFEAGIANPLPGFSSLNLRFGVNDYEHREIEPSGEVATEFSNQALDSRLELVHQEIAAWEGVIGVQYSDREFSAIGEEAFVAPADTQAYGVFWVGERPLAGMDLEAGIRFEQVDHDPSDGPDRSFDIFASSLGLVIPAGQYWQLGLHADYSNRAPVIEELYSNGAHLATGSFEIGNPNLDEEKALNLSATLTYQSDVWGLTATLYSTNFSDFIYQSATGLEEDGLPVLQYAQEDATFTGLDLSASATLARWGEGANAGSLLVKGLFDVVNADLDVNGNDNLPRIPPARVGAGVELEWKMLTMSLDYTRVQDQKDVSELELASDAYDDLRAYIGTELELGSNSLVLFLQGKNLTDDEQRNHASFIKDLAPSPGRSLEVGMRLTF